MITEETKSINKDEITTNIKNQLNGCDYRTATKILQRVESLIQNKAIIK